jgi:hypothetical protein
MIFACLIHNLIPKLTTLPTVQGAIRASSSDEASSSKLAPPPATAPAAPAAANGKRKATAPTPTPKAVTATPAPSRARARAPTPAPAPAPAAPNLESCCFFKTFRSQWQPGLPILECHAGEEGLRKCKNGKILT